MALLLDLASPCPGIRRHREPGREVHCPNEVRSKRQELVDILLVDKRWWTFCWWRCWRCSTCLFLSRIGDISILFKDSIADASWSWKESPGEWVLDLVQALRPLVWIDYRKIYLTGYSMGGMSTWELGAMKPHLFAALCTVAGHHKREKTEWIAQ